MNRGQLIERSKQYIQKQKSEKFIPEDTYIPVIKNILDEQDVENLINVSLDLEIAEGKFAKEFERDLRQYYQNQIRHVVLTNSRGSANLLAITSITAKEHGSRGAKVGDEIITTSGNPSILNPIIQNGLVPVFVDVDLDTFLPNMDVIENAVVEGKTKGIVLAHSLGNPYDAFTLRDICDEYGIWFIESASDALGGTLYDRRIGSFGDIGSISEALIVQSAFNEQVIRNYRGDVDFYVNYDLKSNEFQASLLASQLKKLPKFVEQRRYNWNYLREHLDIYKRYLRFMQPIDGANPAWYGFSIVVKETAPFSKPDLVQYLEIHKIGACPLFGGNLTRQPAYKGIYYKTFQPLINSDVIMKDAIWIGCHPGID